MSIYKCEYCGKFHITSKNKYGFTEKQKAQGENLRAVISSFNRFRNKLPPSIEPYAVERRELSRTYKAGRSDKRSDKRLRDKRDEFEV